MASYYLAPFIGNGSDASPFISDVDDDYTVLDLSPPRLGTLGIAKVPATLPGKAGRIKLCEGDVWETMPAAVRRLLGNRLGVTLDRTRFADLVCEILDVHSRTDGSRWLPMRGQEIHLDGLLWRPISGGAGPFEDDYERADNTDLNVNAPVPFAYTEVADNVQITSGTVRASSSTNVNRHVRVDVDLDSDDHYAEIDIDALSSGGLERRVDVNVRFAAGATTFYGFGRYYDGAQRRVLLKRSTGTQTVLSLVTEAFAMPETIRCQAEDSVIKGFIDGVEKISVTDTAITGNVRTGFTTKQQSLSAHIGKFRMGDLAAPPASYEVSRATEVNSARALSVGKSIQLSRSATVDVARELVAGRTYALPRATDTSTARELIVSTEDVHQLTRATETDAARDLSVTKMAALPRASQADVARPFAVLKTVILPRATEVDIADELTAVGPATYVLQRAVEVDAAAELVVVLAEPPPPVQERVAPVTRRKLEPRIPRVHCRLDQRSIALDNWLATTIANGGFDTLRGVASERDMRRYSSSFEQGAPIRLVLDNGRIIWEGELDANPLPYDGQVELSARGPVMWAEEMEDQYLAQSRDTQLFGDEGAAPFNGSPAGTITADVMDGALHWHVAKDTVMQQDDSHRLIAWIQGSLAQRIQGSIFRTGTTTGFQLRVETLTGPDGTPTSLGGYSVGAGTLVDESPNVPEDAVAVSLVFTGADNYVQPTDLDVYLRDVRIHDIARNDSFTVAEMFADAGMKLGYDVSAVPVGPPGPRSASPAVWTTIYLVTKGLALNEKWQPPPMNQRRAGWWWFGRFKPIDIRRPIGSVYKPAILTSPLNILPFVWGGRWGGNWAGMFDQVCEMLDWRWRIGGNHYGQGPVVDVGPWGPSHDVRVRKNVTPNLSSVVQHTRVEVVYATENRGQARVVRTRDPDPFAHRNRRPRVHKFVLPDIQKDDALATQVADILLEEFGAPRLIGSLSIVGMHGEADETLYDAQGGDLVTVGDIEPETVQPLRIQQTEMTEEGNTAGIGQPATTIGRLALYEANESRRPYGTILRTRDVRSAAEAAKIKGFVPR